MQEISTPQIFDIQEKRRKPPLLIMRQPIPRRVGFIASASFLGIFVLGWLVSTNLNLVPDFFLPTPQAVWVELLRQIREGILFQDAAVSIYRISVGWLISTLAAVPLGILMGNYRLFEDTFEPFIDLVRYMPAVAFIPLTILWVGVGDTQKFLILFIGTFFQEVLLIMDNVKNVPQELIKVSKTLGLSQREILTDVILRCALPGVWDTFRVTLGWAWTYLVVAELVAASSGLGYRIMRAQRFLNTETIILGILVIGALGLITDTLFKLGYKKFFPWMNQNQGKVL
jgi:NitT/TauT family transport system permease protein